MGEFVLMTSCQLSEKTQQRTRGAQRISTATDPTNTQARPVTAEETVLVERVRLEKGTVSEDLRASAEARKKTSKQTESTGTAAKGRTPPVPPGCLARHRKVPESAVTDVEEGHHSDRPRFVRQCAGGWQEITTTSGDPQ